MARIKRAQRRKDKEDVELNITPFMNLMIVLVPVLLLSMVFTHVRVHDIQLPELSQRMSAEENENEELELAVSDAGFQLFFPSGKLLKEFPAVSVAGKTELPFQELQSYLRQVKATFQAKEKDKSDITILAKKDTNYQRLIKTLDAVKFVPEQVDGEEVMAELFPRVALGNAP